MPSFVDDREKKVRGDRVYGRDHRPRDLGWPAEYDHAYLLRATYADRKYLGIDNEQLKQVFSKLGITPPRIIQAAELKAKGFTAPYKFKGASVVHPDTLVEPSEDLKPEMFGLYWLTPVGAYADHIGQPVAILLFSKAHELRAFANWSRGPGLLEETPILKFDHSSKLEWEQDIRRLINPLMDAKLLKEEALYGSIHFIRCQVDTKVEKCIFPSDEQMKAKLSKEDREALEKLEAECDPDSVGPNVKEKPREVNRRARYAREAIRRSAAWEGMTSLRRTYFTQSIDPMFMEPESGLAWFEKASKELNIAAGTQSPRKDRENIGKLVESSVSDLKPSAIKLQTFPIGGGFGGRDMSTFPIYLALAALFSDRPVRLAFDRYEQFLCGIKRHAAVLQNEVSYDPENGALHSLNSTIWMDGGGVLNLTKPVVELCALHAAGPYAFPHNAISGYGVSTDGAPAGSMRGFGIPQAAFAIESMIDEIAVAAAPVTKQDQIQYRLDKLLTRGGVDVTGFKLRHHLDTRRICEAALKEPLWLEREARREEYRKRGNNLVKYGVGFACAMQAIGTSGDAVYAEVSIAPNGEVTVRSTAIEMGQGSDTSLAIATRKILGRPASRIVLGVLDRFDHPNVRMERKGNNYVKGDTRSTPKIDNTMSASVTAFFHIHAVEEAARVVFDHGLKPCAAAIWGDVPDTAGWDENGMLVAPGRTPLSLEQLAALAHSKAAAEKLCTGAIVHTYYKNAYAHSEYPVGNRTETRYIDGLAVRYGGDANDLSGYEFIHRATEPFDPNDDAVKDAPRHRRSVYASVGHLIAVTVHTRSGVIDVVDAVTILDAGEIHHRKIVEGQVDGGFAMGLGMTLLEDVPPAPYGVDGAFNLHRYPVPRVTHMPLNGIQLRCLELDPGQQVLQSGPPIRKKGIAEAVMTTVMPAIANAVAHATGARLTVLPFTPKRVLEALR